MTAAFRIKTFRIRMKTSLMMRTFLMMRIFSMKAMNRLPTRKLASSRRP